jgi:CTP:molybdopterin cytidylyltransferase MocA
MRRVAAIVLAAGASRRLGAPKQLARLDGEPLVRRAARAALGSRCSRTRVVVGAHAAQVRAALAGLDVGIVECADWQEGMAASLRAGLAAVDPSDDGVLFLLCDQPQVDAALLDALLDQFAKPGIERAGTAYPQGVGVPAVFARSQFGALAALRGERGARGLLEADGPDRALVHSPASQPDLDTPEAAAALGAELPLTHEALELLEQHARCFLLTLRKDGSPTAHPMTALLDAGRLAFTTYRKSAKTRNLERDPRLCALLLDGYGSDADGRPRGFEVRGTAEIRTSEGLPSGGVRPGAMGDTSAAVSERVNARMKEGRRVQIDVRGGRVRRVEL